MIKQEMIENKITSFSKHSKNLIGIKSIKICPHIITSFVSMLQKKVTK